MKKQFVYLFRHIGGKAIKIGKASGSDVQSRFNALKIFAPYGAEIIGYLETDNATKLENLLHKKYSIYRLKGEWFDLSDEMVKDILQNNNEPYNHIKSTFIEWCLNPDNNSKKLLELMNIANRTVIRKENSELEYDLVLNNFMPGEDFLTSTQIKNIIEEKEGINLNINKIGWALKKIGIKRGNKKAVYGYFVTLKKQL